MSNTDSNNPASKTTLWAAFVQAYAEPQGSPIRELFSYLSRPGIISFAGGYPSNSLFDFGGLREAATRAMARDADWPQYGATEGAVALRAALAERMAQRGIQAEADEILITAGSQQGFDLLTRVYIASGDIVYIEAPAYPAALQALRTAGADIRTVATDGHGLCVDDLERQLLAAGPRRPKFLYTVPSFSNPAGTLLPQARRTQLVALARRYGLLIVEDDPYGELSFGPSKVSTLYAEGQRQAAEAPADKQAAHPCPGYNPVIYLSSLSKTVAPALRLGWMVAPEPIRRRCTIAKQTSDICTSPISQAIALEYLRSGRYDAHVGQACAVYQQRMSTMANTLAERLRGKIEFVQPQGGMFLWATLTADVAPNKLFKTAVEQGVLFVPGAAFYLDQPQAPALRLSYAAPDIDQIRHGIDRLATALQLAISTNTP